MLARRVHAQPQLHRNRKHILLGRSNEGRALPRRLLEYLGISGGAVRPGGREIIGQGQAAPSGRIPLHPAWAKKVLELSLREAPAGDITDRYRAHPASGWDPRGRAAAQVLVNPAPTNRVRQQVIQLPPVRGCRRCAPPARRRLPAGCSPVRRTPHGPWRAHRRSGDERHACPAPANPEKPRSFRRARVRGARPAQCAVPALRATQRHLTSAAACPGTGATLRRSKKALASICVNTPPCSIIYGHAGRRPKSTYASRSRCWPEELQTIRANHARQRVPQVRGEGCRAGTALPTDSGHRPSLVHTIRILQGYRTVTNPTIG